jgi:hypothetical protein
MLANCENTSTRRPCASCWTHQLHQHVVLRRLAHAGRRLAAHQARIAADLAQLHQRVEDRDRRAAQPLLRDHLAHLGVARDAQALVEIALRAAQLDGPNDLRLGRQVARHFFLDATRMYGATCSRSARRRSKFCSRSIGTRSGAGTSRRRRAARIEEVEQ